LTAGENRYWIYRYNSFIVIERVKQMNLKTMMKTALAVFVLLATSSCASARAQAFEGPDIYDAAEVSSPSLQVTEILHTETETAIATITESPTATHTAVQEITATPEFTPTSTPLPDLPEEYYITGVRGHKQYFPLGCEASVAVDWASFFGVEINEFEFQYSLPASDNPDLGFVGSVEGPWGQVPPYAYGVHAGPIAALLQEYGLNAIAVKELRLEELKRQIAMDRPIIAWVIGNVVGGVPYRYTDSQGNTTVVAAYEHTIMVIGYTEEIIRYNNNGKIYEIPTDIFLNSWGVLGNMAVIMADE
jgi:uncharacterized protein YvpB